MNMPRKLLFNNVTSSDSEENEGNWVDKEVKADGSFLDIEVLFINTSPPIDSIMLTLKAQFNSTLSTISLKRSPSGSNIKIDINPLIPNQEYIIEFIRISNSTLGIKVTNTSTGIPLSTIEVVNIKAYGDCNGITNTTSLKKKGID